SAVAQWQSRRVFDLHPTSYWWRSGRDSNSRTGHARYGIFQCGLRKPPRSLAAGLLSSWNRRGVDVELLEPPIRVVPSAVRVVSPGRMRDPAVERQARVITIVDVVTGVMRV